MSQIKKKSTFVIDYPSGTTPHLHIVLTDPEGNPPKVVVVNLSSCKGLRSEDTTVILKPGDHSYITQDSFIAYDYAKKVVVKILENKINENNLYE
jgi:hypothetical protein